MCRIPFERALDFANKEKITESLYPLFVHNIGALLYHPTNQSRTSAVIAQQDRHRRGVDQKLQGGMPSATQPPSLTHHHSMNSSVGNQQPTSIAPNPSSGRPGIDRAHTFPTPPTSASGTITSLGSQQGSYDWSGSSMSGGVQGGQNMGIDNHSHSTPATPATTPPGSSGLPSLQPYQSGQPIYAGNSASQPQYPSQHQSLSRNGSIQSGVFPKQEMGPPSTRVPGSRPESEHGDVKMDPYSHNTSAEAGNSGGDDEAEHEQDTDYVQSNGQTYGSHRASYDSYNAASNLASFSADGANISSDVNGSGRGTPRTSNAQWVGGYQTPPRAPPSSNLYNPTSDTRGSLSNGNTSTDSYPTGPYAPTQSNGLKRMREDDDYDAIKRRKLPENNTTNSMINGPFDSDNRPMNRARTVAKTARAR